MTSSQIWSTSIVIIYLDDIFIYSDNIYEHKTQCLGKYSADSGLMDFLPMQINASPMSLPANTSDICCQPEGLTMGPIQSFKSSKIGPIPWKVQGYSILPRLLPISTVVFIYGYSEITVPLTCLTHKVPPGNFLWWVPFCLKHFKNAFTTALVLTHWIPDTQIRVKTDASDYALATVLSIMTPDGNLHPIAFHSQIFSAP